MSETDVALSASNSIDLAKRLIEQHIDDIAELLGAEYYNSLDDTITQLSSTSNKLAEKCVGPIEGVC